MHVGILGSLVFGLVGLGIILIIGALLLMLGAKLVMGSAAKFGSALLTVLVAGVVSIVAQLVIGMVVQMALPALAVGAGLASLVAGALLSAWFYTMLLQTGDGRKPDFGRALLIWLIQFAITVAFVVAFVVLAVFVFHVPIPQLPTY
jgi:hypothetical protein